MKQLLFTFIIVLLAQPVSAGRTFTDSDLDIYKQDSTVSTKDHYRPVRRNETPLNQPANSNQNEKEKWCREGKKYRDRVSKAQQDLEKAEQRIEQYRKALAVSKSDLRAAMRNLKRSREKLAAAEEEYRTFEDRAYRQSVPRDWYECYYDGYDEYRGY